MRGVYLRRTSLVPFLLLSIALHLLPFLLWPTPQKMETAEPIPVSFLLLPSNEEKKKEVQNREVSKTNAPVAKNPALLPEEIGKEPPEPAAEVELEEKLGPILETREKNETQGKNTIVRRPLPTLKQLLPPVTWSPSGARVNNHEGSIRLDSQKPKYISYFTRIQRAIELVWDYPQPALQQGLEGKLVLEFTILGNGNLEKTRLIRSSGFPILDEEAIRAVQAASPFHPIPAWIGRDRLEIIASFEYHDNRLKYGFRP